MPVMNMASLWFLPVNAALSINTAVGPDPHVPSGHPCNIEQLSTVFYPILGDVEEFPSLECVHANQFC